MNFRFFNVTNSEEVKAGKKPIVKEVGPYVYREVRRKENVLEVDEDKVKYGLYMEYHFDKGQTEASGCSGCTQDDQITVVNPLLLVITELLDPIPDGATLA